MEIVWIVSYVVLWGLVLFLGFLLLGTLRSVALLSWRLEQMAAVMPKRIEREGLKRGTKAPDFTLKNVEGQEVSLHDFSGRKVLLAFTQDGCKPCHQVLPELNKTGSAELQVVVVNQGKPEITGKWAREMGLRIPVLIQDGWTVSKRYQVFATPFAFLIDEKGIVASKGVVNNRQHIGFVLSGARDGVASDQAEPEEDQERTKREQPEAEPAAAREEDA